MKAQCSLRKVKTFAVQFIWEFIGSVFIAAGIYNFAVQAKFPMTGFSGISIILYRLLNVPIGLSTILLNIPLAIICYRLLGKKFFVSSLRCMILSSIMIGYALIYSKNSSTGGSDFIIMAVKAIKPHLSLGKIAFWSDVGIILVGGIFFRDIDGIIYGMVVNFIFAVAVDKLMYGINSGKLTLIVTEHGPKICEVIDECCQRGTTILKGQGGYNGEEKQVVMCACSNKEMFHVQQAVKKADPASFLIVLESNEVHGEGFKMVQIGEEAHE